MRRLHACAGACTSRPPARSHPPPSRALSNVLGAYQHRKWASTTAFDLHRHHHPTGRWRRRRVMVSLPDFRDVRRAPSRMIHEGDHETIEVKMAHWGAPFYVFTDPDDQHRSIVHESELDRPEKVRTVPHTRNPSFFAACVANLHTFSQYTLKPNTPTPLLGACWCHSNPRSGER